MPTASLLALRLGERVLIPLATSSNLVSGLAVQLFSYLKTGGEEGIRTLDTLLGYTHLANGRFEPLSHLSVVVQKGQGSKLTTYPFLARLKHS